MHANFFSSFNDELLEVVGLYSSLHIAKVRVNLTEPIMLGQARNVKVWFVQKLYIFI